jgi:phosphomannomutase
MDIDPKIFKAYDIRGIYPTQINKENFVAVMRGIISFFIRDLKNPHPTVVLGRDMRVSSPELAEVAKEVLVKSGAHVIDIGLSPTPTFYFAVVKYGYDCGIDVTASHNPKDWEGTKFVKRDGSKIIKIGKATGMDKVKQNVLTSNFVEYTEGGSYTVKDNVLEDEVNDALATIDVAALKPYKVACDPANGMGSLYVKKLFEKIPGELITMNFELDGTFPAHQADPLDFNNLIPLQDKVKEVGAQLGLEPDGDGDRIFFIDEKGEVVPATLISALIAKEVLERNPGAKIVVDIRYTRNVQHVVEKYGGTAFISKVGHAFITNDVNEHGAYYAGESSGHFYFGSMGGAESAVRVILYVLAAMSETGKPLSQIVNDLKTSFESGEFNFVLPDTMPAATLLEELKAEHQDGQISTLDGIAVDYPDWRLSIRTSNTEPLLRLNVEANTPEMAQLKLKEMTERILKTGAKPKEAGH